MSKHAPGPWAVEWPAKDWQDHLIKDARGFIVATPYGHARLIAAAPDLLAACECAVFHLTSPDAVDAEGNYDPAETVRAINTLRAAISKARGQ